MDRTDDDRPLEEVCADLIARYHLPLSRLLQCVREQLARVPDAERTPAAEHIRIRCSQLADQVQAHLSKEQHLLFPALDVLVPAWPEHQPSPPSPCVTLLHPISMLKAEHQRREASIGDLRALACDASAPESAIAAWQPCLSLFSELETLLRELHREENERLFPWALDGERRFFLVPRSR